MPHREMQCQMGPRVETANWLDTRIFIVGVCREEMLNRIRTEMC